MGEKWGNFSLNGNTRVIFLVLPCLIKKKKELIFIILFTFDVLPVAECAHDGIDKIMINRNL